jgi:hypothetical protein
MVFCEKNLKSKEQTDKQNIFGVYSLYKDDDEPNKPPEKEELYFYRNGDLLLKNNNNNSYGKFIIKNNKLQFVLSWDGSEAVLPEREYLLVNNELKIKNKKVGFIYYKLIKKKMPIINIKDYWKEYNKKYFSIKVPSKWMVKEEKPNKEGHQRFISLDKKQAFSATHKIIGLQNFVPIKTQGFCVSITQRA